VGVDPFYLKSRAKLTPFFENADFQSTFVRSASVVTPSEKVQLSLTGSPLRAFQWAWDEHRTLYLCPQRVARKRSVQFWTI